ncbi:uncharacterized protein LOC117785456 isoform X4 [Drosophila innubila]|uniref:uncharacterized protein LOC117785456 isoform X4 n=1 Tax=Drosophila innubila TaxID=198719 RepID=UPI00148CDC62|nr:uncharacterized protein LOC117785456 isoform X4 [Drosophila innubila]
MSFVLPYFLFFFFALIVLPIIYMSGQYLIWIILFRCCGKPPETPPSTPNQNRNIRVQRSRDRQNNSLELGRQQSRYGDIFFIEPNSPEAARIREQLEKDEKDLPSYDEVMRMCNLTTPTAAAALPTPPPPPIESTSIGIAALPAPPYTENDPHPNAVVIDANAVTPSPLESTPSTSRAAQIQIA